MSAISPDGRHLAFVGVDSSGLRTLWLRALASETAVHFENTDGAVTPFFSPDSQHIGFFADGKLKRIPVSGGAPETLCNVDQPAGGTWNRNNVILFSQSGRLYRVSAGGGATTELSRPDAAAGETNIDTWPQFLPDGRRFIVSTATHTGHINTIRTGILIGATQSSKRKLLVSSRSRAAITSSGITGPSVPRPPIVAFRTDAGPA
jgi:Tol biopolymer transport system component